MKRSITACILAFLPSLRERAWGRGLLIWFVLHCGILTAQIERLEVSVTFHDGLGKGIGEYAMNGLSFVDWDTYAWKDLISSPKGIPGDWTETRIGVEFLNQPQFIYQHIKAGQISEGFFQSDWLEDAEYTAQIIRCYLLFADGLDVEGNRRFVIDQNNNGDLSDDTFFYADSMTFEKGRKDVRVKYDAYTGGEVVPRERTMYLGYNPHHAMYLGKIAEYATCELNGVGCMLSPFGYNYMGYEDFEVIPLTDITSDEPVHSAEQPVRRGEYMHINDELFCFKGLNVAKQAMILEKDSRPLAEIQAMQAGFKPYPFNGVEFATGDSLSLADYKGKTLLLMVWSPGCGSCIDKIPLMNEIYTSVDSSKVRILGLALHTDKEHLATVKEEHSIAFPLMIGEHGKINEAYIRLSTPTFFLINPEGMITLKTFHPDQVKEALSE